MAKIRYTKNELKKQRDILKRYERYLPILLLKKQQLQIEMQKIHRALEETREEKEYDEAESYKWVDVFCEDAEDAEDAEEVGLDQLLKLEKINISSGNIAGIDIPVFEGAIFKEKEYDLVRTPLWVDKGIEALKRIITLNIKIEILIQQEALIKEELRITTQRVNLFEKIMIPLTRDNIRRIQIYLGDMYTASVITGKIAKGKIEAAAR